MDKFITVLQCILPIFAAIALGMLARKKQVLTQEDTRGMQKFVTKFALPCVFFNCCVSANISAETVSSFAMVLPIVLCTTLLIFRYGKKYFPYHNTPIFFCAKEVGMLGIPLFVILFGASETYRIGVLDVAQLPVAFPVIAILTADFGENPSKKAILSSILRSPTVIMSALGLALNFTGIAAWLQELGLLGLITGSTEFLAQPVSAVMIFCVGYNFSMTAGNSKDIFRLSALHMACSLAMCLIIQLVLLLIPDVDPMTRWAILMFCTLPPTFLAPSLGRSEKDFALASGVCSLLTLVSLAVFCAIAIIVA